MNPRPTFEISIDTKLIYDRLADAEIGDTVTFKELSGIVRRAVVGADPHLQSALHRVFSLDDYVFGNVRGIGYRRLNDEEIVTASTMDSQSIRRKAKKAAKKLTKVQEFNRLPADKKTEHNARLSIFAAIANASSEKSYRRVEDRVSQSGKEIPFAETLDAFKKGAA